MENDIKFIKTDKEGIELQLINDNYPNSFINVNSKSEKNLYIGSERVTDNYNLGVEDNSITNNVGGMSSGINAYELKGKSISEILDIILFSSNNNLELKGINVVDKIVNLTDDTLKDVYIGKVVFVIEDGNIYVLKNIDFSDINNWEKQIPVLPNMEEYYKKTDIDNKLVNKQDLLTAGSNVIIENNEINVNLTNYAKTEDLTNYALIENLPKMEDYVLKSEIENVALKSDLDIYALKTEIPNTDGFVSKDDLTNYAKTEELKTELGNYYIKTDIDNKLVNKQDLLTAGSNVIIENNEISVNLTNYALKTDIPIVDNYVSKEELKDYALIKNLPNMGDYYTKSDIDISLTDVVYKDDLNETLNDYYVKSDIDIKLDNKQDLLSAGSNVIIENNEISVNLTNYAKTEDLTNYALIENLPKMDEYALKSEIENVAYKNDLSVFALKSEIENVALKSDLYIYALKTEIPNTDSFALKEDLTEFVKEEDLNNYALIENLPNMEEYYTKLYVDNNFVLKGDLTDYAKTSDIPDLSNYALKSELIEIDNYYTKDEVNNLINNIEELIGHAKLLTEEILG